jgi:hypothetical protein
LIIKISPTLNLHPKVGFPKYPLVGTRNQRITAKANNPKIMKLPVLSKPLPGTTSLAKLSSRIDVTDNAASPTHMRRLFMAKI